MSVQGLVFAVVGGSAALAAWVHVRRDGRMPQSTRRIVLHALAALATTLVVPLVMRQAGTDQSRAAAMTALFALVVPMFVYNFLTWLWLIKLLQRHLRPS
jgi:TRAP-type C4-dicarboxylate transport system permease large subunit